MEFALTTMNLGIAYAGRKQGNEQENQELAIAYFSEALTVLTKHEHPVEWAKTTMNFGSVLQTRNRCNAEVERAINMYLSVLTVFTEQEYPVEFHNTSTSLFRALLTHGEAPHVLGDDDVCIEQRSMIFSVTNDLHTTKHLHKKAMFAIRVFITWYTNLGDTAMTLAVIDFS